MQGSIHKVPGIDDRGRKNYTFRVAYTVINPVTGQRRRTTKRGFKTKHEAQEFLTYLENEDKRNSMLQRESFQPMKDYLEVWLETVVSNRVKPTTASDYKRIINTYILPYIGAVFLKDISGTTLDTMFQLLQRRESANSKKTLSPRTLLYIRRILHKSFADAVRRGYIDRNPCDFMLFEIKAERFTPNTYDKNELLYLLKISQNTPMAIPIALASVCGLRRGEVLAITPNDLNQDDQTISISKQVIEINGKLQFAPPKTETSNRTVFIPKFLITLLEHMTEMNRKLYGEPEHILKSSPILRNNKGQFVRPRNLSNQYSRFLKANGMRHIRFHDLRHSYASLLYEAGIPLKTTSALLGHSTIEITADIYTHLNQKTKNKAAEQLCNSVFRDDIN